MKFALVSFQKGPFSIKWKETQRHNLSEGAHVISHGVLPNDSATIPTHLLRGRIVVFEVDRLKVDLRKTDIKLLGEKIKRKSNLSRLTGLLPKLQPGQASVVAEFTEKGFLTIRGKTKLVQIGE